MINSKNRKIQFVIKIYCMSSQMQYFRASFYKPSGNAIQAAF